MSEMKRDNFKNRAGFILACIGSAVGMDNVSGAAMTYMIATELVSLLENLQIFGLDIPLLRRILDIAQGDKDEDD